MSQIKIDIEKVNQIKDYLLNRNLKCSYNVLVKYIDYIEKIFSGYETNPKLNNFKNRKCYNHTFDVILNAIKYNENVSDLELEKNIIIATLHDIGRGPEVIGKSMNFPTAPNLNHTELGIEYLFDDSCSKPNIYNFLTEDYANDEIVEQIKQSIKYHSTLTYPKDLPISTKILVENIRFYDKAAIMEQFVEQDINLLEDVLNVSVEDFLKQNVTEELMEYFMNKKCIDRALLYEKEEYNSIAQALSPIGFIFDDCNDKRIYKYLKDINWVKKYINKLPLELMSIQNKQKLEKIAEISLEYINDKTSKLEIDSNK